MDAQVQASRAAVLRQLDVLREGSYIDAEAQHLDAELLLYNSALRCFVIVRVAIDQSDVGTFETQVVVQAVNTAWPLTTVQGVRMSLAPALAAALALIAAIDAVVMVSRSLLWVRTLCQLSCDACWVPSSCCSCTRDVCCVCADHASVQIIASGLACAGACALDKVQATAWDLAASDYSPSAAGHLVCKEPAQQCGRSVSCLPESGGCQSQNHATRKAGRLRCAA